MANNDDYTILVNGEKLSIAEIATRSDFSCRLSDSSITADITLFTLLPEISPTNWYVFHKAYPIANSVSVATSIGQVEFDHVKSSAIQLADDRNELWPHDHAYAPNNKRDRVRDPSRKPF